MTATSLKAQLFAAASVFPALTALLGTAPFRWYDQQLQQGTSFPAMTVQQISRPRSYVASGQMPTSWARMQFTIFTNAQDSESSNQVVWALEQFLQVFNAATSETQPTNANYIIGDRDGGLAPTQPLTFQRFVDARIFSNENL